MPGDRGLIATPIFRNADGGNGVDRSCESPRQVRSVTYIDDKFGENYVAVPRSSREDDTRPAGQQRKTLHDSRGSSAAAL
jgi:hypothetical protein